MTSRDLTGLLAVPDGPSASPARRTMREWAWVLLFGFIGWPWLLFSLWGGTRAAKRRLLDRLGLPDDALPHLGSWKADAGFLHHIVDTIAAHRPACVVELGAGASTLVCAQALRQHGGGRLVSYEQHAGFAEATARWLREHDLPHDIRHAPLVATDGGWPGRWYGLADVPARIDLLIIDGPPWSVHPLVRGAAERLFHRLAPGAVILLDDAARPGERLVARRWRRRWRTIAFDRPFGSTKGTLRGQVAGAKGSSAS